MEIRRVAPRTGGAGGRGKGGPWGASCWGVKGDHGDQLWRITFNRGGGRGVVSR